MRRRQAILETAPRRTRSHKSPTGALPQPSALLLALSICLVGCGPAEPLERTPGSLVIRDGGGAHFPNYHDFGKVPHGDVVRHTFVLDHAGDTPVTLLEVQTECHCTRVGRVAAIAADSQVTLGDPTRTGLIVTSEPGSQVELEVVVDTGLTHNYNRDKLAILRMRTDSLVSPYLTLELHVIAQKLFEVSPGDVRLDDVPVSNGITTAVRILRDQPGTRAEILDVKAQGELCSATIEKDYHFEDPVWTVLVTVPPGLRMGPFRDSIVLNTTDDEGNRDAPALRDLEIPIFGNVVEDVRLYPNRLVFPDFAHGSEARLDAYLKALVPGAWVKVIGAHIEGPAAEHVSVECIPKAEDTQGRSPAWDIVLQTSNTLPAGPFAGTLRLELDDSQTPEIMREFSGSVLAEGE